MITIQRGYEIITACDGLINSPNISAKGKLEAQLKREEIIKGLIIFERI